MQAQKWRSVVDIEDAHCQSPKYRVCGYPKPRTGNKFPLMSLIKSVVTSPTVKAECCIKVVNVKIWSELSSEARLMSIWSKCCQNVEYRVFPRSWVRVFLDIYYKSVLTSYKFKIFRRHIKRHQSLSTNLLKRKIKGI